MTRHYSPHCLLLLLLGLGLATKMCPTQELFTWEPLCPASSLPPAHWRSVQFIESITCLTRAGVLTMELR